eukprot:scaffold12.g7965.t1
MEGMMRLLQEMELNKARMASQALEAPEMARYWNALHAEAAQASDRRLLGAPVPLLLFGSLAPPHSRQLQPGVADVLRAVMAGRQALSDELSAYCPVMGIADGSGSHSPARRFPYDMAVANGLSDAGLHSDIERGEAGVTLLTSGDRDTATVVELAGQRGCVVLDLAADGEKRLHAAFRPGMLAAAKVGYYGVVVGKRKADYLAALSAAFAPGTLLELSASDLEGASRADRAAALLWRVVRWQREQPREKEAAAALGARVGAPASRKEARSHARDCPCCSGADGGAAHDEAIASSMFMAVANPGHEMALMRRGGVAGARAATGIGNVLATAPGGTGTEALERFEREGLSDALFAGLAAARGAADYLSWGALLSLAANATRFGSPAGSHYRQRLLERGLEDEAVTAKYCRDAPVRAAAERLIDVLGAHGAWHPRCAGCGKRQEEGGPAFKACSKCRRALFCTAECQAAAHAERRHRGATCRRSEL